MYDHTLVFNHRLHGYANKNIIYDGSTRLGLLNNPVLKAPIKYVKQGYATMDTIHLDSRFSGYKKKYYIYEIDQYMRPTENYYIKAKIHSIPQLLMYRLINDPETMLDLDKEPLAESLQKLNTLDGIIRVTTYHD